MTAHQQEKYLRALIDIGRNLAATTDIDELLDRILLAARELFNFQNAIIRLLDDPRQVLVTAASYGYDQAATERDIAVGQGVMGQVAQDGQFLLIGDLSARPDYIPGIPGARSELAVPLIFEGHLLGVLSVESDQPDFFSLDDVEPLTTMAAQAAIAIANAQLVSNLKTLNSQYRELHQFNQRILASASLGIYTIDDHYIITSWNPKIAETSGMPEEMALGQNLFELFPTLAQENFGQRLRQVLKTGQPEKLRLSHRNLRGEKRFQKRRIAPLKELGRTVGAVVMVEDITEFKHLLDQTIQGEKLAEIGRLTAGIVHEINNPLSVLSYAVELLRREEDLTESQLELVDRIDSEVARIRILSGGLLSFSRQPESRMHEVAIDELLKDVVRLIRHEFSRRNIHLEEEYNLAELSSPVLADPNKLKQVFINLLMNAVHALDAKPDSRLTVRARLKQTNEIEIDVVDNGTGIQEEVLQRIFDPFFTTKPTGEGTGLGLYICRNIIADHGGRLEATSTWGSGSTFRVILPIGTDEKAVRDMDSV